MKPLIHCKSSRNKWGGTVEDYMEIHEFFDQTKAHIADVRHRAVLHKIGAVIVLLVGVFHTDIG